MTLERRNSFSRIRRGHKTFAPHEVPPSVANVATPVKEHGSVESGSVGLDKPPHVRDALRACDTNVTAPGNSADPAVSSLDTAANHTIAHNGARSQIARSQSFGRRRPNATPAAPANDLAPAASPADAAVGAAANNAAAGLGDATADEAAAEEYEDDFEELEEEEWVPLSEVEDQIALAVGEEKARSAALISELRAELDALKAQQAAEQEAERSRVEQTVRIVRAVREAAAAELAAAVSCARKAALAEAARVDALREELAAARASTRAESARADALRAEIDSLASVHVRSDDALRALGLDGIDAGSAGCVLCAELGECCVVLERPQLQDSPRGHKPPNITADGLPGSVGRSPLSPQTPELPGQGLGSRRVSTTDQLPPVAVASGSGVE